MIAGLMIGEYKSIGKPQYIYPLNKINIFVGTNNSGKSNVLRFINDNLQSLVSQLSSQQEPKLKSVPHAARGKPTHGAVGVFANVESIKSIIGSKNSELNHLAVGIHENTTRNDVLFFPIGSGDRNLTHSAIEWGSKYAWQLAWAHITNHSGGNLNDHWIPQTLAGLSKLLPRSIAVHEIPLGRKVESASGNLTHAMQNSKIMSGSGVIRLLASMQNPPADMFEESYKKFEKIQQFARDVLDDDTIKISVPYDQNEILVQFKQQRYFPLASLGSGIEQVVLHAVAATSIDNAAVTLEEPELHLHPSLQKKFMMYLDAKTNNQYFIATHSAHLIDTPNASVFHVRLIDGETRVQFVSTDRERFEICERLGYRPSDIVQSNCVIWVEGPSDRLYIRHWISLVDPDLLEHVQYSIMFYGGKLLSHVSVAGTDAFDRVAHDLIQLRRMNRQTAVVIDSDKSSANDEVREAKRRICEEITKEGGVVWMTEGREIENYVNIETLRHAVDEVLPGAGGKIKGGKYSKLLKIMKGESRLLIDKVAVAKAVIKQYKKPEDVSGLDLQQQVKKLCSFIRMANGLPQRSS